MGNFIDLTGKTFGNLTVLNRAENSGKQPYYNCVCVCGTLKKVRASHLKHNKIKSCGCLSKTRKSLSTTRIYNIWKKMNSRCKNSKDKNFKRYGEKGIKVCHEWNNDFLAFYNWAINNGYDESLTIDRINTNGNYEPLNCRWATMKLQQNNRSNNKRIEYKGETLTLAEWCDKLALNYDKTQQRLARGWAPEKAFVK